MSWCHMLHRYLLPRPIPALMDLWGYKNIYLGGAWLWHSWHSGRFWYQWTWDRIQSSTTFMEQFFFKCLFIGKTNCPLKNLLMEERGRQYSCVIGWYSPQWSGPHLMVWANEESVFRSMHTTSMNVQNNFVEKNSSLAYGSAPLTIFAIVK